MVLTLLQKCQRARQITGCVQSDSGHVMNWGQDSLSAFPPLGLPSCQGGNGHKGPQLYVPTTQRTGDQFMFINVPSHTEESLCRPVLQGPFPPEPAAQTPEGGWGPGHCPRYHSCHSTWLWESISSLGKTLNSSHFPKTCSSPEMLKCREGRQGWASPERKGRERNPPGLSLWSLIWASGGGRD